MARPTEWFMQSGSLDFSGSAGLGNRLVLAGANRSGGTVTRIIGEIHVAYYALAANPLVIRVFWGIHSFAAADPETAIARTQAENWLAWGVIMLARQVGPDPSDVTGRRNPPVNPPTMLDVHGQRIITDADGPSIVFRPSSSNTSVLVVTFWTRTLIINAPS